jgi:hypothetical protein
MFIFDKDAIGIKTITVGGDQNHATTKTAVT